MPDLDESWVVEAVTWSLYVGFLSVPVSAALYFELEPLVTVQGWLPGVWGTAAAIVLGVGFLLVVRLVFNRIRGGPAAPSSATPSVQTPQESPADPASPPEGPARKRTRSKKKKKKKKRGR